MNDARLQIAFGELHRDGVRGLLAEDGPAGTLRRLRRGSAKTTDRVREAVSVPAATRRDQLTKAGVDTLLRGQAGYPELLADLPDAPDILFVRGWVPQLPAVAVAGTRRCTSYGERIAQSYGRAIASAGWPLVSGLARGIDGSAAQPSSGYLAGVPNLPNRAGLPRRSARLKGILDGEARASG